FIDRPPRDWPSEARNQLTLCAGGTIIFLDHWTEGRANSQSHLAPKPSPSRKGRITRQRVKRFAQRFRQPRHRNRPERAYFFARSHVSLGRLRCRSMMRGGLLPCIRSVTKWANLIRP